MEKARIGLLVLAVLLIPGFAFAEENVTDPCAGIVCNTPPTTTCEGGQIKTYSSPGTCSAGACSYPSSVGTGCQYGCTSGRCKTYCEYTSCGSVSRTCPDGFTATCQKTCSEGTQTCSECEPSCAGHETPANATPTTNTQTCVDSDGGLSYYHKGTVKYNPQSDGTYQYELADSCSGSTLNEYSCENGLAKTNYYTCPKDCSDGACKEGTCPTPPPFISCQPKEGYTVMTETRKDPNGCAIGYECKYEPHGQKGYKYARWECYDGKTAGTDDQGVCHSADEWRAKAERLCSGACNPETGKCGLNTFVMDGECSLQTPSNYCPAGCECRYDEKGYAQVVFCKTQGSCNYNGVCERGEENGCSDCISADSCPVTRQCRDGTTVSCFKREFGCSCEPCPLSANELPFGCKQEIDKSTGFIRVDCEGRGTSSCPSVPANAKERCVQAGGHPSAHKSPNGCELFFCDFGGQQSSLFLASRAVCPSPSQVEETLHKCESLGLRSTVAFEGGCKIGRCLQEGEKHCQEIPESEWRAKEEACRTEGRRAFVNYGTDGCKTLSCGDENSCPKELPKEAYNACNSRGGELIVKRDFNGCVSYTDCVRRGDSSEAFVEDVKRVPESSELLQMAFKLEELKLELDKLARKSDDIANYYKSTGSSEEQRFRRIAGMFNAAKDEVDEIRTKIREKVDSMTKDDATEIKRDLRYIKDVVIKDIVYVMLSDGDEIEKIKSDSQEDCGDDMECFNDAFRICQPIKFNPDGEEGPVVEVTGLEDKKCVMHVTMSGDNFPTIPGISPPYEMTCKLEKYSLGVSDPEKDVFPYCTGNLVILMKTYMELQKQQGFGGEDFSGGDFGGEDDFGGGDDFGSGLQGGVQSGLQAGLQAGIQSGLQAGVQSGLQAGVQQGIQNACVGCLNNGVCDVGECRDCRDCIR